MSPEPAADQNADKRLRCLTEWSAMALVGGALALSALLWLAIVAVL